MAYSTNQKISGLDGLTTTETDDLFIVGDTSDDGRAKKITEANLVADLKATGAEVDTGTEDAKFVTPKALADAGWEQNASTTQKGIVEEATQAEVDAGTATGGTGARLFINPSTSGGTTKSVTAGATINGATLPVPVYQNKTDNEFYACDGNDLAALKFLGFAVSNGTDGAAMAVKFAGIVSGFTGLDEGEKYYLADAVGTIANAPGTYEVLVGVAISATELLIQKGKRRMSGTLSLTSASGDQAITTGFRPSSIRVFASAVSSTNMSSSWGVWTVAGSNDCVYGGLSADGSASGIDGSNIYNLQTNNVNWGTGAITTITDTGFTITESISTGTVDLIWEAEGEL